MSFCSGIEVTVFEARKLRDVSMLGLDRNDPYIAVEVGSALKKTSVKPNAGKAATWNEKLTFQVSQINTGDTIRVRAWDRDHASSDDKIGGTIIGLKAVVDAGGYVEQFFVLYKTKMGGKTAGEVKLGIRILQSGNAAQRRSSADAGKALYTQALYTQAQATAHPVTANAAAAPGYPPSVGYPTSGVAATAAYYPASAVSVAAVPAYPAPAVAAPTSVPYTNSIPAPYPSTTYPNAPYPSAPYPSAPYPSAPYPNAPYPG